VGQGFGRGAEVGETAEEKKGVGVSPGIGRIEVFATERRKPP